MSSHSIPPARTVIPADSLARRLHDLVHHGIAFGADRLAAPDQAWWRTVASPATGAETSTSSQLRTSGPPVWWMRMAWDMVLSSLSFLARHRGYHRAGVRSTVNASQAIPSHSCSA